MGEERIKKKEEIESGTGGRTIEKMKRKNWKREEDELDWKWKKWKKEDEESEKGKERI